jgi:hypothetical protein
MESEIEIGGAIIPGIIGRVEKKSDSISSLGLFVVKIFVPAAGKATKQ